MLQQTNTLFLMKVLPLFILEAGMVMKNIGTELLIGLKNNLVLTQINYDSSAIN